MKRIYKFRAWDKKEKKEIIAKAGKDAQKMMQETIRKASPAKGEEIEAKVFYIIPCNEVVSFISSLRSQAYEEGRRETIEEIRSRLPSRLDPVNKEDIFEKIDEVLDALKA